MQILAMKHNTKSTSVDIPSSNLSTLKYYK